MSARATRCPVLARPMELRACYAKPGTDVAYAATSTPSNSTTSRRALASTELDDRTPLSS
eukprot:2904119-Rhodomonas_salina.1